MQIGQILVEQRWIEPAALARALAEQRHTGKRICSLLIARGLLDPDDAARALATQHSTAGVLQRHLDNRDRSLIELLPAAIARACHALPIGRTRTHELIVCVCDPRPELTGILATAAGCPVVIAVAPASQLELLIKQAYEGVRNRRAVSGPVTGEVSFDVDLSTRPISTVGDEMLARMRGEVDIDLSTRPIEMFGSEIGELGKLTLVGLDDARVARDPTQSGPVGQSGPLVPPRTLTAHAPRAVSQPRIPIPLPRTLTTVPSPQVAQVLPRTITVPAGLRPPRVSPDARPRNALDPVLAAIASAATADAIIDAAMQYVAGRFTRAVLFAIHEGAALGDRGHGGQLTAEVIQSITIPLSAPSIVQAAHDTRRLATAAPPGAGMFQDRLARTLGSPGALAALPIEVGAHVPYVIAVADTTGVVASALDELERLGAALGAAYQRLAAG